MIVVAMQFRKHACAEIRNDLQTAARDDCRNDQELRGFYGVAPIMGLSVSKPVGRQQFLATTNSAMHQPLRSNSFYASIVPE